MAKTEVQRFDPAILDTLNNPDEIARYFADKGVNVSDNEIDGIKSLSIVDNKDSLIDVSFLILSWKFNPGDYGNEFVSAEIMLRDGSRFVLNDGGTGIAKQLRDLSDYRTEHGHPTPFAGRMISGGLRKSSFWFHAASGQTATKRPEGEGWAPASTYYLDF